MNPNHEAVEFTMDGRKVRGLQTVGPDVELVYESVEMPDGSLAYAPVWRTVETAPVAPPAAPTTEAGSDAPQ